MSQSTTALITGCKSGIGKALLTAYAARDNYTIIAAIRDGPNTAAAEALEALPIGKNSKIIVIKYDASNEQSVNDMIPALAEHGIEVLDVVVANAGILKQWGLVRTVKAEELNEHFAINTVGPIQLYQTTISLLEKSEQIPKFFIISSSLGSNGLMDNYLPMQIIAYNMSKSAINAAAGRIHREEEKLVIVPMQPGWIATDMGSRAAVRAGMNASDPPVQLSDAVAGLTTFFDKATKAEHSGKFFDQDGKSVPW